MHKVLFFHYVASNDFFSFAVNGSSETELYYALLFNSCMKLVALKKKYVKHEL